MNSISSYYFFENKINSIYLNNGKLSLLKLLIDKHQNSSRNITNPYFYIDKDGLVKNECSNKIFVRLIFRFLREKYLEKKLINWLISCYKKSLKYTIVNDNDLLLKPFQNNENDDYLVLKCYNKLWRFTANDLKNILTNHLENTMMNIIPDPIIPRNPYLSDYYFNIYQLNLIYNFLEKKNQLTDTIILYKLVKFDIDEFLDNNIVFLRKRIIFNEYKNMKFRPIIIKFYNLLRYMKMLPNNLDSCIIKTFLNRNNLPEYQKSYFQNNLNQFKSV